MSDERAVRSEPVATDGGEEVVVTQQNVGPGNQVGGGEFKNVDRGRTPEEAAEQQRALAEEAPTEVDESASIQDLHGQLLGAWNDRDAKSFAALFATDGALVGFDGSTVEGITAIEAHLDGIFTDHQTGSYVASVREVRLLAPDVGMLRAVAGMVPPGASDVDPSVNAIQALVAVKHEGSWHIALFQNTPAAFHGQPAASAALTEDLRRLTRSDER